MIKLKRYNSTKLKKAFIVVSLAAVIAFSSVVGIFSQYVQSLTSNDDLNDDWNKSNKKYTNLQLNIPNSSIDYNKNENRAEENDGKYLSVNSLEHSDSTLSSNPNANFQPGQIEERNTNQIKNAYLLMREIAKNDGILFYDMFNCINSNPVDVKFSDEITYSSILEDPIFGPLPERNITYYIFTHTDLYPEWIAADVDLSKTFDFIWFYLYFYESLMITDYIVRGAVGQWLLSIKDFILNCFWIEKINSEITDDNGVSKITQDVYYIPGKYNIICLADIDLFAKFNNGKSVINSSYLNPFPKPYNRMQDHNFSLFRMFYDHLTVERENTLITPVNFQARYSDVSDFSICLTDDEMVPPLKPYPWNHDNYMTDTDTLISDEVDVDYYLNLTSSIMYLGKATTDVNGYATLAITTWIKPGTYTIIIEFNGTVCYLSTSFTTDISIEKEITKIEPIQLYEVNNTDDIMLISQLLDDDDNGIPQPEDLIQDGREISYYIMINSKWETIASLKTNSEGYCYIQTSFLLPYGEYSIKVEFDGDDYYLPTEKFGMIIINREQTYLRELEDITVQTTDYAILTATLTDNELVPIINKTISFKVCVQNTWQNIGTSYTDENGVAEYSWQVQLSPGTYLIRAVFNEDDFFTSSKANGIAIVEKEDVMLKIFTTLSDSHGEYQVSVQLTDDDFNPISGEEIEIIVNGEEDTDETNDEGYAEKSVSISTFDDLYIEAEYDGSEFYENSQEEYTKSFSHEIDAFFDLSEDLVEDLFQEYIDINLPSNVEISDLAELFYKYLKDIKDGELSDISIIQDFISLLGSNYWVTGGSDYFDFRLFEFFPCPWTNGNPFFTLSYESTLQPLMTHNEPFTPEGHVDVGTRYDFDEDFYVIIQKIYDYTWSGWEGCSDGDVLSALGYNSFYALYLFYGLGYGDETINAHDSIPGDDEKYRWNLFRFQDWIDLFNWEWVYDMSDSDWKYKYEYLKEVIKDWVNVEDGFTVSIPSEYLEDWSTTLEGLFWDLRDGILGLVFDFSDEHLPDLLSGALKLLELLGIDIWELLEFLLMFLNKAKKEQVIDFALDNKDEAFETVIEVIGDIEFFNIGGIANLFTKNSLTNQLSMYSSINPNSFMLPEDFSESDVYNLIGNQLFKLFGFNIGGDDMEDLIDELEDVIDDLDYDSIGFPQYQFTLDPEEINAQLLPIILNWKELKDITFSDTDTLLNLIYGLSGFDFLFELNYKFLLELIINVFDDLGVFDSLIEIVITLFYESDPFFWLRGNEDIFFGLALFCVALITVFDVLDAFDFELWDRSWIDDLLTILVGIGTAVFGAFALISSDSDYKDSIAMNYIINGGLMIIQGIFELLMERFKYKILIYLGFSHEEASKQAEYEADLAGAGFEIVAECFGILTNWYRIENEQDFWEALKWSVADGLYSIPDAILPLFDPKKHPKTMIIFVALMISGLAYTGYLTFKAEDWF